MQNRDKGMNRDVLSVHRDIILTVCILYALKDFTDRRRDAVWFQLRFFKIQDSSRAPGGQLCIHVDWRWTLPRVPSPPEVWGAAEGGRLGFFR